MQAKVILALKGGLLWCNGHDQVFIGGKHILLVGAKEIKKIT